MKKGEIVDVVGPATCDISMDGSRELIQGVDQELLETAPPRRGGAVLVLCGKHKGAYGSLVDRDMVRRMKLVLSEMLIPMICSRCVWNRAVLDINVYAATASQHMLLVLVFPIKLV